MSILNMLGIGKDRKRNSDCNAITRSKYDDYWRSKPKEIKELIEEALLKGNSKEIDVTDIKTKKYGDRKYWGTHVIIPPGVTEITEELSPDAHGKSLGNVIISSGILKNVKKTLVGRISEREGKLSLRFEIA